MAKETALSQRARVYLALDKLGHPARLLVLEACADGPTSPKDIAKANPGYTLGTVSYHVRALADDRLIKLSRTTQVRGAVAHFYVTTAKGRRVLEQVIE